MKNEATARLYLNLNQDSNIAVEILSATGSSRTVVIFASGSAYISDGDGIPIHTLVTTSAH